MQTQHPKIGSRAIAGLPLDDLHKFIDKAQSIERRIDAVIVQADAVDLTPETMAELVRSGWSQQSLDGAAREGARYSPSRDSLLFPTMFGD